MTERHLCDLAADCAARDAGLPRPRRLQVGVRWVAQLQSVWDGDVAPACGLQVLQEGTAVHSQPVTHGILHLTLQPMDIQRRLHAYQASAASTSCAEVSRNWQGCLQRSCRYREVEEQKGDLYCKMCMSSFAGSYHSIACPILSRLLHR